MHHAAYPAYPSTPPRHAHLAGTAGAGPVGRNEGGGSPGWNGSGRPLRPGAARGRTREQDEEQDVVDRACCAPLFTFPSSFQPSFAETSTSPRARFCGPPPPPSLLSLSLSPLSLLPPPSHEVCFCSSFSCEKNQYYGGAAATAAAAAARAGLGSVRGVVFYTLSLPGWWRAGRRGAEGRTSQCLAGFCSSAASGSMRQWIGGLSSRPA